MGGVENNISIYELKCFNCSTYVDGGFKQETLKKYLISFGRARVRISSTLVSYWGFIGQVNIVFVDKVLLGGDIYICQSD